MIKKIILITFFLNITLWLGCDLLKTNDESSISSPDGRINIKFLIQNGKAFYKIAYKNMTIINQSKLGFLFKNLEPLNSNFKIIETNLTSVEENWKPVLGPSNLVKNHYNELQIKLKEDTLLNREMELIFRAYNPA